MRYPHLRDLNLSPRLKARLHAIPQHRVATVIAPTGYGKSTAMRAALEKRLTGE